MKPTVLNDTSPLECVRLSSVTKEFRQRQNSGNILNNLFHPSYKRITALDNVDLHIQKGEFVAYAGPNGAGKSTTFRLLCGMLAPNEGQVQVFGLSPQKNRVELMGRLGVLFGNRTELWADHPVISSFIWKQKVWNIDKRKYERMLSIVTEMLDIGPFLNSFVRELSLGQRMRADLAMLLLHEPELILLDEPTLGLDVLAKRQMINFLKTLNEEMGTTILVTSHDMDDLTEMAKRIVMIHKGKIAYDGGLAHLRETAGAMRSVTLSCEGPAPSIPHLELESSEDGRHSYHFDTEVLSIQTLLQSLSQQKGIKDVELGYPPIELMIADLYFKWKEAD